MKHDGLSLITMIVLVLVATFANAVSTPCRRDVIQGGNQDPIYDQEECVLRL